MALRLKERELAAVGISVAAGCRPCTDYHLKAARKARASDGEIRQAMNDAAMLQRKAADITEDYAMSLLGEDRVCDDRDGGKTTRLRELVSIGTAYAINSTPLLEWHLDTAHTLGVSDAEIEGVVRLAMFIKDKADVHVRRLAGIAGEEAA